MARRFLRSLAISVVLFGCSRPALESDRIPPARTPTPSSRPVPATPMTSVLIDGVPHVQQKPDFCGEAATASWLGALGVPADQDRVFAASGMDPALGMGVTTRELKAALEHLGFSPGPVWQSVRAGDTVALDGLFRDLYADLEHRIPSIVCMHYDDRPNTTEHFRLVLGYDAKTDEVVYHEPAVRNGAYRRMSRSRFEALWPLKYEPTRWTLIRLRLDGATPRVPARSDGFSAADYAQHVLALKSRIPAGFSVVVEPPFVVLGDDASGRVRASAEHTVRWAVERFERDFFPRPPARILDIWLFKDDVSYRNHGSALFGSQPDTPYGYFSSEHGALVMNIATGGGTLVHEMVHAFMETNFPGCPAWFNEGLGSLFEQSADRGGHIVGLTNWRLAGLQRAIRRGRLTSFHELLSTTSSQFYEDDRGTNYAQARYLLYYLQEHGMLLRYYREFLANHAADPTGYATLVRVLSEADMAAFQKRWEADVLSLTFP